MINLGFGFATDNSVISLSTNGADSIKVGVEAVLGTTITPNTPGINSSAANPTVVSNTPVPAVVAGTNSTVTSANPASSVTDDPEAVTLPLRNELRIYNSYNYILTLSCLNHAEYNSPATTYRVTDPVNVILRSAGGVKSPVRTAYEQFGGRVEYFIDNLEIDTNITGNRKIKQTNATSISFQVTEPFSVGIFLQSLQVAAINCGFENYLEAPYLLTIDFKGWDDKGNPVTLTKARRLIPLNIASIDFDLSENGSVYNVIATPNNEEALTDQVQTMKADIQLQGRNLWELCQSGASSIMAKFNDREQKRKLKNEVVVPNEYVVLFPKKNNAGLAELAEEFERGSSTTISPSGIAYKSFNAEQRTRIYETISGASTDEIPADFDPNISLLLGTIVKRSSIGESIRNFAEDINNVNEIGKAVLVESYLDGNKQPFGKAKFVESDQEGVFQRGKVQIQLDKLALTFKSRTTILEMLEELVLLSSYGKKIAEEDPDEFGLINYFKIETNVLYLNSPDQEAKSGAHPKIFIYKVMPYKAHVSKFSSPSKAAFGLDKIATQIVKHYHYMYTGFNDDVLDFQLKFDSAFYTSYTSQAANNKASSKTANQDRMAGDFSPPEVSVAQGAIGAGSRSGKNTMRDDVRATTGATGGGQIETNAITIARDTNDAILNSETDLVSGTLKIWGDPYYLSDSGMGNYTADINPISINLTADGTMNYQDSDVHIQIDFRTPLDYGKDGWMEFNNLGREGVNSFTGLYQVTVCKNKFEQGVFTQELDLIRIKNQPAYDTDEEPTNTGNSFTSTIALPGGGTAASGVNNWEEYVP